MSYTIGQMTITLQVLLDQLMMNGVFLDISPLPSPFHNLVVR